MPEELDKYVAELISMLEEYIQNYEDKQFVFCNAILNDTKIIQAFRSRSLKEIYDRKDEYNKIAKHHKIQPEKLLETKILDALSIFVGNPDKIDKYQLLRMENELIKMVDFVDDEKQAYKVNYIGFNIFSCTTYLK